MQFQTIGFKLKSLLFLLFLFCLSSSAHADAGTPLMWTTFLHLSVGNALIGIGEGLLIIYLFRLRRRFTIPIMIAANYLSMVAGMILIPTFYHFLKPDNATIHLTQMTGILWKMGLLTFIATLLIEWPFCLCLFAREEKYFKKSILADLAAQSASYAVLIPIYLYSSIGLHLPRDLRVDQSVVSALPEKGTVYFLSPDTAALCSVDLRGGNEKRVMALPQKDKNAKEIDWGYHDHLLAFYPSETKKSWDLWVKDDQRIRDDDETSTHPNPNDILLLKDLAGRAAGPKGTHFYQRFNPVDLRRDKSDDPYVFVSTYGPMSDVEIRDKTRGELSFFVETPFMRWDGSFPTLLPGDRIVFEFDGQILLLDLNTRKIGLIANGWQPVVILQDDAGKS